MLYELKLPKLSVTTFRLSAAHQILEVRQLGKQPRSQPKLRGGTCWAPNAICALRSSAPAAEGLLSQCLPPRKSYSVSGGNIAAVLMSFFSCCLSAVPQKWPSQIEVSFHLEETFQNPLLSCLAQGGKAWFLDFSSFSLLTDSQDKGQVSK